MYLFAYIKLGGVNFAGKSHIGAEVTIDGIHPELIYIDKGCTVTSGTKILTHFYSVEDSAYDLGTVHIKSNCLHRNEYAYREFCENW